MQTSKIFFSESVEGFSMKFFKFVLWATLYQTPSADFDPLKTWPPMNGAFLLYAI